MVEIEEVLVTDLYEKYKGKELYKGFYTVGKRIYQDDGEIVTKSIDPSEGGGMTFSLTLLDI